MTGAAEFGRCVLIDVSGTENELLRELPGLDRLSSADLDESLAVPEPVDLVVIGSLAGSPVALAQRAHRLVPGACIAVLAADPPAVRRQASFAPGVPLDLVVAGAGERDLPERLEALRRTSILRRRHAAVLSAVARHAATVTGTGPSGLPAIGALLEHAPIAVLVAGLGGELLGWNRRAEALLDLGPLASGQHVDAVVPGASSLLPAGMPPPAAASVDPGPPLQVRLAGRVDVEISAVRTQTDDGRPVALFLAVDVTAHREAERERDRLAGHVQLLARITESLVGSLDPKDSLSVLAGALVPALADWVSIQVREEHDQRYDVVVRHRDRGLADVTRTTEQLEKRRGCVTEASRLAAGGARVLLPMLSADELVDQVPDPELRGLVQQLGLGSAIAVPIPSRTGVLGSLLLANAPGSASFREGDLVLASEIGRRAGIALESARLFAGQRNLATELQQSLLTAPPVLPFAEIAVRYVAAAQAAQVGGDWYDAFRLEGGELVVVIGDVAGHDTRAAAAMGQLRAVVRGIGFTTAADPGRVLSAADEAIAGLELAMVATAVVAQLAPAPGRGNGTDLLIRWSNAGHPPPVLLDADGRARVLEAADGRADLLLGVDPATGRRLQEAALPAGSTLLLYTDGLVERRRQSLDEGLARLIVAVEEHGAEGLEALCDAVLSAMVPRAGEDDVALIAVRPRS